MENLIQEGSDFSVEMDGKHYVCKLDVNYHSVYELFPSIPSWWILDMSVRQYEESIVRFIMNLVADAKWHKPIPAATIIFNTLIGAILFLLFCSLLGR